MKQTIEDLRAFLPTVVLHEGEYYDLTQVYFKAAEYRRRRAGYLADEAWYLASDPQLRDAAFMNALTQLQGMPYVAKLTALHIKHSS